MIGLRDGSATQDARLDRLVHFDERSRDYPIRSLVSAVPVPRGYSWAVYGNLVQGKEGACVGFSIGHELLARPAAQLGVTNEYARGLYHEAQKIDPWPGGSYPGAYPFYEGTSVLAGIKAAVARGHFTSYRWAFSLDDLILGVGYKGPAVLGVNWHEGMDEPDADGFIDNTGDVLGGHAILCYAVSYKYRYFRLWNSWGGDWGIGGSCKVSFDTMERLLYAQGEAVFPLGRKVLVLPDAPLT